MRINRLPKTAQKMCSTCVDWLGDPSFASAHMNRPTIPRSWQRLSEAAATSPDLERCGCLTGCDLHTGEYCDRLGQWNSYAEHLIACYAFLALRNGLTMLRWSEAGRPDTRRSDLPPGKVCHLAWKLRAGLTPSRGSQYDLVFEPDGNLLVPLRFQLRRFQLRHRTGSSAANGTPSIVNSKLVASDQPLRGLTRSSSPRASAHVLDRYTGDKDRALVIHKRQVKNEG